MATFVLFFLTALAGGANDAPAAPSLFGIPLGISEQQFSALAEKSKLKPNRGYRGTYGEEGLGIVETCWSFEGTVNPVPGPSRATVWFADGRLYKVFVTLGDVSEKGWERIKRKLGEKYGEGSPGDYVGATPVVDVRAHFEPHGVTMGYRGYVGITYTDLRIVEELAERTQKRVRKNDTIELDKNL